MELLQGRARLDAKLGVQHRAEVTVGRQGVRLPPRAVEREHQLGVQPFSERVLGDEAAQLADHRRVVPEGELGADARLERGRPTLVQTGPDGRHEVVVAEVLEDVPAPKGQGRLVGRGRGARLIGFRCGVTRGHELLEPGHVDATRVDVQPVATGHGHQDASGRPARPVGFEHLPRWKT